jgi:hypothetical protein
MLSGVITHWPDVSDIEIYRQLSAPGGLSLAYAGTSISFQASPSKSAAAFLARVLNAHGVGTRRGAATQARIAWTDAALVCFRLLADF